LIEANALTTTIRRHPGGRGRPPARLQLQDGRSYILRVYFI